ncbi:MAG: S9 family peptidase [Microbacteriaceae bacterium]|nr:S9 family peptidase [Microbacteriaceae bacterium]
MIANDVPLLTAVSRPTVHPDGSRAVVAVSHPDLDADAYVGQLWTVPLAPGASPTRLTRGRLDSAPQFSPDGRLLAFLRDTGDGPAQLHVVSATGGESVRVTEQKLGIGSYRWSPDSTRLAFTARVPEHGRYGTVDDLVAAAEPPRRFTTLRYRSNGIGYTTDRHTHVFIVDVPDPTAEPAYRVAPSPHDQAPAVAHPGVRQLTSGPFDHGPIAFSPDGTTIAVVAARHDSRDEDLATDVFALALGEDAGAPQQLTDSGASLGIVAIEWAPDGTVYVLGTELGASRRDFVGRGTSLWALGGAGLPARRLTDPATHDLGEVGSHITVADQGVLVQNRARGRVELLRIGSDGTVSVAVAGDIAVTGHDAVGDTIVASFTSPRSEGELGVVEHGRVRQLTDFSAALAERGIAEALEFMLPARDGHTVHGWVLEPEGKGPHPVLLNIHGGPFAQYGVSFFDEAQVYVAAGYAVVLCNPRGAAGYGEEHARAIRQRMGTVDLTDVLDFLEGAIARRPRLDGTRVGIMGGSYGGYLTAWAIAHDHRFAAAIVERGYLDPEQFVGTSDIGSFFTDEYAGTDPELLRAQSPQAVVDRVSTSTLVLHSADDLRCPLAQGERYYAALARNGVPTELLVFPGENHELTRSGRPRHRVQRFAAILDWWARYLPTERNHVAPDEE